jgi:hypothetical protein
VYDKETQQYVPALVQQAPKEDFFNDPVRIVVPNRKDAKGSRTPMPGTGNRMFKRGH